MEILNFELYGKCNNGGTIVIAHGLFGSRKNWRTVAKNFSETGRKVVVVDMRNHGLSFWSDNHSYEKLGEDLKNVIKKFDDKADLIGHSMGGKAAMSLALDASDVIRKLVVVDISPTDYFHDWSEYICAMQAVNLNLVTSRKDLDLQLESKVVDPSIRAFLIQSADFSSKHIVKWLVNLSSLRKNLPKIMSFPKFSTSYDSRCLFIRGGLSAYILDDHLAMIRKYFPNFELFTVEGAGHWVHSEKKEKFCNLVLSFLDE